MEIDRAGLEARLPHRGRALMLDGADFMRDETGNVIGAMGYRIVTEEDCEGHVPGHPTSRGTDRVEMITLTLGLAAQPDIASGYFPFFYEFGRGRFPAEARVGDLIRTEAILTRHNRRLIEGYGKAFVGDILIAEVEGIVCLTGKLT